MTDEELAFNALKSAYPSFGKEMDTWDPLNSSETSAILRAALGIEVYRLRNEIIASEINDHFINTKMTIEQNSSVDDVLRAERTVVFFAAVAIGIILSNHNTN